MNEELQHKLEQVKKSILVFDIETCATYPGTTTPVNISTNFEDYVKYAKCKWFGCYSYKHDKYVGDLVLGNEEMIKAFIADHDIVCGFNNEEFDTPICYNNDLMPDKYLKQIDCLPILGSSSYFNHKGLPFKDRGSLMGFKFKKNSLKHIAQGMNLETQKGDIDYKIFFQDTYTQQETEDIKKYLEADVMATKQMLDKLWDYWLPFTEFLTDKDVLNLSWIKASIASLTYKAACKVIGQEATYGEKEEGKKEAMGGRVIEPVYEEARNVWYVDFTSLYPHIMAMFNLFNEVKISDYEEDHFEQMCDKGEFWMCNELFQTRGCYDISKQHPLSIDIIEKLKERKSIKNEAKKSGVYDPKEYAIKIFLNSLYGAARSPVFEKIHTENLGWDCCWLGQQIQKVAEDMMTSFGFETIAGDTDSIFVVLKNENMLGPSKDNSIINEREYVKVCLKKIVDKIKANVPFPADTYNIDIEAHLDYVMWPFSDQPIVDPETGKNIKKGNRLVKERKGKKKNYCYLYEEEGHLLFKLVGLPIKKDNATVLGPKIFKEILEPLILTKGSAKFTREFVEGCIDECLNKRGALELLTVEYKVKPVTAYKNPSQIQAQISAGYFAGQEGVIRLIKNKVCGQAGKTAKYCTVEEAIENHLTMDDLDLVKVHNELEPFVEHEKQ